MIKKFGLLLLYTFLLGVVEGTYLVSLVGSFYGTKDGVGSSCVGPTTSDIATASEIYLMTLKEYQPVYCRT